MTRARDSEEAQASDQLPEEAPASVVPDPVQGGEREGAARAASRRHARAANRSGHRPGDGRESG